MSGEANKNSEIDKAHCLTANWLFSVHGIDERVPEHRLQIADLVTGTLETRQTPPLPPYMEGFFTAWRKLPQEKKDLVSVHQTERGEWFLSINGIRVLMQNLRAEKEGPGVSIKDIPGLDLQSYFAFRKERKTPGRRRAKNEEWEAMATTIGGWGILGELLQIPLVSFIPVIAPEVDWEEMSGHIGKMGCIGTLEPGSGVFFVPDDGGIDTHFGTDAQLPIRLILEE